MESSPVKAKIFTRLPYRVGNYWKDGKRSHVFVQGLDGGAALDVSPGDFDSPPIDLGGSRDYDLSPDGKEVVFTRNQDPVVALSRNNDLFLVPATGGAITKITENPTIDNQPIYSPDGAFIAYRKMDRPGFEADRQQLMLYAILADTLESIFGAVFLDAGFEAARSVVLSLFGPAIASIDPNVSGKDAKTRLQEWLQAKRHPLPDYQLAGTRGEAHDQIFVVACHIPALGIIAQGQGRSRRAAEQEAALAVLKQVGEIN